MKTNLPVTQRELDFDSSFRIISTTNTKGILTSINNDFLETSGFTESELIGKSHNIIRHPDMPVEAFADLWSTLKAGKPWMGMVKNRCKNGDHYWVNAYVTPIYKQGVLFGYQSVRTKPTREYVAAAERLYSRLKKGKSARAFSLAPLVNSLLLSTTVVFPPVALLYFTADISWMIGLGALALGVVAGVTINGFQSIPVNKLAKRANTVYHSDLCCLVYKGNAGPLAQVEVAIQAAESQQITLVELIQNSASHLLNVIASTNEVVKQTNDGITHQSDEVSQLATAMNEMTATIQDVARNAQETADKAASANILANEGKEIIEQTSFAINQLVTEVEQAGSLINQLKEDANNITNIINVIDSIAEQTNLLALNAAIEAARAGESGRGFAVVADEVRSLASRTQASTTEIEAMIHDLQNRTTQAAQVMDISQSHAAQTVEHAQRVDEALNNIALTVNSVNDMNTQIATATEEQGAVSEEINRNVTNINDISKSLEKTSAQTTLASQDISNVAEELSSVVTQFRS
ncbi:MAG: aerotaxis receptor [Motiliproteus sp.]|jgi:aerotaxis receptor